MITLSSSFSPHVTGTCGSASFFNDTTSSITDGHLDNLAHQRELELAFCKDFVCCNTCLEDLHDLLQHYEEHHVQCDEEECHSMTLSPLLVAQTNTLADFTTIDPVTCLPPPASDRYSSRSPTPSSARSSLSSTSDTDLLPQGASLPLSPPPLLPTKDQGYSWMMQATNLLLGDHLEDDAPDRPYKCKVQGCDKSYKNANGLKYHRAHGHCLEKLESDMERNAKKPYHCAIGICRKRYKNLNGLKYHIEHTHMAKLRRQHQM